MYVPPEEEAAEHSTAKKARKALSREEAFKVIMSAGLVTPGQIEAEAAPAGISPAALDAARTGASRSQ